MARWEAHVGVGGAETMRRFDQMAAQVRDSFPIGRRPTHGYHLARREQTHEYSQQMAEDAYLRHLLGVFVGLLDRKSTRLNSSHVASSYAVFCLKKKKTT